MHDEEFLRTSEAADFAKLSINYLAKLRIYGGGPRFCKVGKAVRYRKRDLVEWMDRKTFSSTSECREVAA